jgi:Holliday junction resolvasome RuvABC DNA-binding subunit
VTLCGCGSEKTQPPAATNTGRPDTKAVEAARAVGYDGKQMRKSVDKALDGTEQRNKELQDALKQ